MDQYRDQIYQTKEIIPAVEEISDKEQTSTSTGVSIEMNKPVNDEKQVPEITPATTGNGTRTSNRPHHISIEKDEGTVTTVVPTSPLMSPRLVQSPLLGDRFDRAYQPFGRLSTVKKRPNSKTFGEILESERQRQNEGTTPAEDQKHSYIYAAEVVEPTKLSNRPENVLLGALDLMYLLLPLVFVLYGIMAAILHGKPTAANINAPADNQLLRTRFGYSMLMIQNFIPTLFPMMFGLEVAYLIRSFALWRAQQGTRLGFLEQLMGSLSLGGSMITMFGLQIFNFIGIFLVVLWLLAPVGSQAGLRMIDQNGTLVNTSAVFFMSTESIPNGLSAVDSDYQYYTYAVNSVYSTSIITPSTQMGPQDAWANVKIPSLEWLQRNDGCDSDDWCSFDLAMSRAKANGNMDFKVTAGTYCGMTGVPVVGGHYGLGYQEFNIDVSYWYINTSRIDIIDPTVLINSTLPSRNGSYDTQINSNIWKSGVSSHPNTFFVDTDTPLAGLNDQAGDARNNQADNLLPRNLYFGSRMHNTTALARSTIWLSYVEVEVHCNFSAPLWNLDHSASMKSAHGACFAARVRRSPIHQSLSPWTPLDQDWHIPQRLFDNWPDATGPVPFNSSSPTEKFINGTVNVANSPLLVATDWLGFKNAITTVTGDDYVDITALDTGTFAERFALLFNTYWHCYCNLQALTQTEIGLGLGDYLPANAMFTPTLSKLVLAGQFYTTHFGFWSAYMVAALVATAAGITALFLKYNTIAPDVFQSVSMWVKENRYTPVPAGGTALPGLAYSKRVMDMPVKFLDIKPDEPSGHIALVSMETNYYDNEATRLRMGRPYN